MDAALRISIVSFDLDGTLVDSAGEIAAGANAMLADAGLPARPAAEIRALIGAGTRELVRRLHEHARSERPLAEWLDRFDRHYGRLAGRSARAYPGCADTLARLRAAGVKLACVTNKESRFVRRVLDGAGIGAAFDLVVGGDTLPRRKPDAAVLDHVVQALGGRPSTTAHVGDSRIDVEAARNAGVAAWAVPWGYDGGEPVVAARPDRLFDSLPAVADAVLGAPALSRSPA